MLEHTAAAPAGAVVDGLRVARASLGLRPGRGPAASPQVVQMLLARAERDGAAIVVAGRHGDRGGADRLGPIRSVLPVASASAARMLFPRHRRGVTDPMRGFFLVRPGAADPEALRPRGCKLLLELLVRCDSRRRAEESKGSPREGPNYLRLLGEPRSAR